MAVLEPANYKLKHGGTGPTSSSPNKRFLFVKLTDSALKAVEDLYKKNSGQASIQIGEKQGCIRLPNGDVFNFGVAEMRADGPNGSFECVKKSKKGELEYLGDISQRVTVNAKEDSFNAALERFATQDEQSKKSCAKELPNPANRGKVKRPAEPAPAPAAKKVKPDTTPSSTSLASSTKSSPQIAATASKKPSVVKPVASPYPSKPSALSTSSQPVSRNSSSTNLASMDSPSSSNPPATVNKNLKPLKERVIHALALRPMLKADLISKLQKFGYREDLERSQLEATLLDVANYREGKYELLPALLSQVDAKWPLYSPSDCAALQKRLSMLENRPENTGSRNGSKSSAKMDTDHFDGDGSRSLLATNPGAELSPPPSTGSTPSPPDHTKMMNPPRGSSTKTVGVSGLSSNVLGSPNNMLNLDKEEYGRAIQTHYPTIHSAEERRRYKADFYADYRRYQDLHEHMARISQRFLELEGKLRRTKAGSPEYKSIAKSIKDEYGKLKNDKDYILKRKHWENLTLKLSIIKHQIKSFDSLAVKS